MSVQAGIWNIDGSPLDREVLIRMGTTLAEYAPDGVASHFDWTVGMLYRPLHTTSESRHERQPFVSDTGQVMTWDGRLDNRNDLISQLRGCLKDDKSDVAIVAAAFKNWGTDCFVKLIGDWALAIWDPREQRLVLARDYIGIRHLFYYKAFQKVVMWCSHLAPLALCGRQLTVCDEYIAGYFGFHPDAHLTPYLEIRSVPPGKLVLIRAAEDRIESYWEFDTKHQTRYRMEAEYEDHFRCLFRQSVRRRLRSDLPVLAELSGGLDSSSIVCMADSIIAGEGAETPRVDTFSYFDSKEPTEDDLSHLIKVEEKRKQTGFHFDLKGSGASLPLECPTFAATPGFGTRAEIQTALHEVVHKGNYRVMLCGTGGDEMNGQPLDPRVLMADLLLDLQLLKLTKQLKAWALLIRCPLSTLLFQTVTQLLPLFLRIRLLKPGKVKPWFNPGFVSKYKLAARQLEAADRGGPFRPSVRDSIQTVATLARLMTYVSPSIVEKRYPYLDRELVEFLTTIPSEQLLRPGLRRCLMRRALRDIVPMEILARKTKTGAGRCYAVALEKHWDRIDSLFRSPLSSELGYIDRENVRAGLLSMKNGLLPSEFLQLLKIVSLELWLRDAVSRGVIAVSASLPSMTLTR